MEIREDLGPQKKRAAMALLAVLLGFGILHLRIGQLQLLQGTTWRRLAENNRLRRIPEIGPRGRIYDRRGVVLADNVPTWDLLLFPDEARDVDDTVLFLARMDVADAEELRHRVSERRLARMAPLIMAEDLSWQEVARIRSHQSDHPELAVVSGFRRSYPLGAITAHAVGHLRLVSQDELDADPTLDQNALVGAIGIEALRNEFLSGSDGARYVVVSAVGQQIGVVREEAATAGHDLATTLDSHLQEVAARALGDHAGTVVALDPQSGAVRVLYSAPSFHPELFVGRLSRDQWRELTSNPRHPLQDRSLQGVYPPGSTIKPFLTLAGLAEGEIGPGSTVTCRGGVTLYGHLFRCWRRSGHGVVSTVRSLEVSCDPFYYQLGYRMGIERMAAWFRRFGFGGATGIGLVPESTGLIGTPDWSRRVRGTPWYPGEAISVSIGQGPLLVTTLQLARAYAALANGGLLVTPHLVESAELAQPMNLGIDPDHLALVVRGLERVVHGTDGTARSLSRLPVAGKTGTAQVARLQEGVDSEDLPEHLRHHALFVGWAPLEEPRLVVAAVVEHGLGGASAAAPVVAEVIEAAMSDWQPQSEGAGRAVALPSSSTR
jgi:penicillin-binding protein 2